MELETHSDLWNPAKDYLLVVQENQLTLCTHQEAKELIEAFWTRHNQRNIGLSNSVEIGKLQVYGVVTLESQLTHVYFFGYTVRFLSTRERPDLMLLASAIKEAHDLLSQGEHERIN